jgi:hypothetical protein
MVGLCPDFGLCQRIAGRSARHVPRIDGDLTRVVALGVPASMYLHRRGRVGRRSYNCDSQNDSYCRTACGCSHFCPDLRCGFGSVLSTPRALRRLAERWSSVVSIHVGEAILKNERRRSPRQGTASALSPDQVRGWRAQAASCFAAVADGQVTVCRGAMRIVRFGPLVVCCA